MQVLIVQQDEGGSSGFAIKYGGTLMMNLGNPARKFDSAAQAKEAADLAVDLTGHRCYWACSAWT